MKKVYTCFCTDVIHEGHLNIINHALKYGELIVGILSDKAMIRYNRFPTISFEERVKLVERLEGVSQVVTQDDILYDTIMERIKPDYVIHGDNWKTGPTAAIRNNVLINLKKHGGKLLEIPYTYNDNVRRVDGKMKEKLIKGRWNPVKPRKKWKSLNCQR